MACWRRVVFFEAAGALAVGADVQPRKLSGGVRSLLVRLKWFPGDKGCCALSRAEKAGIHRLRYALLREVDKELHSLGQLAAMRGRVADVRLPSCT